MNFKDIHIGQLINIKVKESEIQTERICNFLKCTEDQIQKMFESKDLETGILLAWCKLLEYDFFRIYSHHLILFSPQQSTNLSKKQKTGQSTGLPEFRKNVYTIEIINFIIELITSGEKTKLQVINDYGIPKTTLYKWLDKYKNK